MKLLSRLPGEEALKELEKKRSEGREELAVKLTSSGVDETQSQAKPFTITLSEGQYSTENAANREVRAMIMRKKRTDRSLCCALSFIITLCFLGMVSSIGGALYLKYNRQHIRQNRMEAAPHNLALAKARKDSLVAVSPSSSSSVSSPAPQKILIDQVYPEDNGPHEPLDEGSTDKNPPKSGSHPFQPTFIPHQPQWEPSNFFRRITIRFGSTDTDTDMGPLLMRPLPPRPADETHTSTSTTPTPSANGTSGAKPRDPKKPPTFVDILNVLRRALRIPSIRVVRD